MRGKKNNICDASQHAKKNNSLQVEDNIKNITFPCLKNINLGERMYVSALSLKKKEKKRQEFHLTLQKTDFSFLN